MTLGTVICWIAWGLIVYTTDPTGAPWFIFLFFYLSLLLALIGSFSLIGLLYSTIRRKQKSIIFRQVRKALRQGILFAALVTGALFLRGNDMLSIWTSILLIFAIVVFESMFLSKANPRKRS